MNPGITILVILIILILFGLFYWYTLETELVEPQEEKEVTVKLLSDEFKIATLSNYGHDVIETRIVNVIIYKNQYYLFSDKTSYHVQQLNNNNRVSLLICYKVGNIYKQTLLYGKVEIVQSSKNLILYKLNIEHRKISISRENKEDRTTNYTYDQTDPKELTTNFSELSELIADYTVVSGIEN